MTVDDDAGSGKALALVLKLSGHQPIIAHDVDEALSVFEERPDDFDMVIADHMMPGLTGLDLVRKLRESNFAGEIIVLTAYAAAADGMAYRRLGIAGMMEKPFNVAELRRWVDCLQGCRDRLCCGANPMCKGLPGQFCWLHEE